MVIPDLEANNTEDNSNLSKPANDMNTLIISKRNKDIFGRCKPGGCLDPPFGEDKYSYLPTQQKCPLPVNDESVKPRSSSIFKNKIFKRKKRSSLSDDELCNPDINKESTKRNLNDSLEASSHFSSAVITYPHPSDSKEFPRSDEKKVNREEEKSHRKRYSSDERSKTSTIENGSYFIIPKKTKNLSSDLNKIQKNYPTANENDLNITKVRDEMNLDGKNISYSTENLKNIEDYNTTEPKPNSHASTLIPITLLVPLNAMMDSNPNNEISDINSELENNTELWNDVTQNEIKTIYPAADQKILKSLELETLNSSGSYKESDINTIEKENHIEILRSIKLQDMSVKQDIIEKLTKTQDSLNDEVETSQSIMKTTSKENCNASNVYRMKDNEYDSDDQIDIQSESLFVNREKSIIDIATDLVKTDSIQNQSENYQNVPISSHDLKHIWKNEAEALRSLADVISKRTISPSQHDKMNINDPDEIQHNSPKPVSHNVNCIYEENSKLVKSTETAADDTRNISEPVLQVGSATSYKTHSTKTSAEDVTKKMPFDKEQIMVDSSNVGDDKPELFKIFPEENVIDNKDVQSYGSKTSINKNNEDRVTKGNLLENLEKLQLPEGNVENLKSVNIFELNTNELKNENESTTKFENSKMSAEPNDKFDENNKNNNLDSQKDIMGEQYNNVEHSDDSHNNKVGDILKVAFKETSYTSISDNITIEEFPHGRQRSVSEISIMGSASITQTTCKEHNKILKINSNSNLEEAVNVPTKEKEINENEKLELKTQFQNIDDTDKLHLEFDKILPNLAENFPEASNSSKPTLAIRKDVVPWKIDIALQSYVNENNEKVIKTFNSTELPERRPNDGFLAARCYLRDNFNEIKIPIDQDNELTVTIANVRPQQRTLVEFNDNTNSNDELCGNKKVKMDVLDKSTHQSQTGVKYSNNESLELYRKKKIKIDVPVSDTDMGECTDFEEINKSDANKYNKAIMSGDIRSALNLIYEEELVPLQGIIKGLREEIDALAAYQMKLNALNLSPKRSKPIRLVHPIKKPCCPRRL